MTDHHGSIANNASPVVDNEQIFWSKVYDLFESTYREQMCTDVKSTTKRKIHIDHCEPFFLCYHISYDMYLISKYTQFAY